MKQSIKNMGKTALVCTLPLWGYGTLAGIENLKIESREYINAGDKTVLVHRLRNGEVRVMDRGMSLGCSYLVDSDNDGKLDYRYAHVGGVNFASGTIRTNPPTEQDDRLYAQLMGQ